MLFRANVKTAFGIASAAITCTALVACTAPSGRAGDGPPPATDLVPAGGEVKPAPVRIVDFGDDFAWYYAEHTYRGENQFGKKALDAGVDVDGDGDTDDDAVSYFEFSLDKPLNPLPPCWDLEAQNAVFYGGMTLFYANYRQHDDFKFSEMCTNVDHGNERDNINMMVTNSVSRRAWGKVPAGSAPPYRVYGIWLWKKDGFMNGGDKNRVTFGAESRMATHTARYWHGVEEGRWVVQDDDQFYLSEATFTGAYELPRMPPHYFRGVTRSVRPDETKWAEYNPKGPYHIDYYPARLKFKPHTFVDVRTVGYVLAKHDPKPGEYTTGVKLEAFEVEAVVHRPWRPSESLDMAKIPAAKTASSLYMSRTEIPYTLYQKVHRWSVANMYAFEPGFTFDRDGDMGSMDLGNRDHGPMEPATDMTWLDAVAWCNALSEREGKTPCYYADPEFTKSFRKVKDRSGWKKAPTPTVYVKWDADGYRLPTSAEWQSALGRPQAAGGTESAWTKDNSKGTTHPVGTRKANRNGLHDMIGNVWEYVWDAGDSFDAAAAKPHTVLGGGFNYPETPLAVSASPAGDRPYTGSYNIGFRVVRNVGGSATRALGGTPAATGFAQKPVPTWTFGKDTKTNGRAYRPEGKPVFEMVELPEGTFVTWGRAYQSGQSATVTVSAFSVARHEITFAKWNEVYQWAKDRGYAFAHDGDMGSMYRQSEKHTHAPDEPVTRVSWYDAAIWCNALSEKEGKKPCYYLDAGLTGVYREAVQLHMPMGHYGQGGGKRTENLHIDWSADGYRLPTQAEWEYACRAGSKTEYFWGKRFDRSYLWCAENSDGTTHPAGKKKPNAFGLHDTVGNVFEWLGDMGARTYGQKDEKDPAAWWAFKGWQQGYFPMRGGSFRFPHLWKGSVDRRHFHSGRRHRFNRIGYQAYPEIGFRVVQCEAGSRDHMNVKDVDTLQKGQR